MTLVEAAELKRRFEHTLAEREVERQQWLAERQKLTDERDGYHALAMQLMEQVRRLELGLLGQKAERLSPESTQLAMQLLAQLIPSEPPPPTIDEPPSPAPSSTENDAEPESPQAGKDDDKDGKKKRRAGRRPLPENLPRVEIEVLPPEVENQGKDHFERIGEEVREVLERRRASLVVVRVKRGKWVRKDRERNAETQVLTAEAPELPIERGLAGPGLLAETVVRRFDDHQPANRQERISAREGFELSRSTLCDWHYQLYLLTVPLLGAMWQDALSSPYLCTDATGVLVQAKDRCRTGHFFTVVAPERYILYSYSPKHDGEAIGKILKGYKGALLADAHAIYDHLYRSGDVVEVGCWSHARRYFFKSIESDSARAHAALAIINELFRIERESSTAPPGKRRSIRQQQSRLLVERLFAWCDAEAANVLDDTPIARAIGYARNQRVALQRFLSDERLPIHNNASENALRRQRVGENNWTFLGSDDGGKVNAGFVSLLATCRLHGTEPWAYLRDLFCLLPGWPARRVLELSPAHWNQTRQHQDTQQRLAANLFRRVTMESEPSHLDQK